MQGGKLASSHNWVVVGLRLTVGPAALDGKAGTPCGECLVGDSCSGSTFTLEPVRRYTSSEVPTRIFSESGGSSLRLTFTSSAVQSTVHSVYIQAHRGQNIDNFKVKVIDYWAGKSYFLITKCACDLNHKYC